MDPKLTIAATIALAVNVVSATPAFCAPIEAAGSEPSPSLIVYNENFAVVRDTILLNLVSGINHITYTGITSKVEPDSVILLDSVGKRTLQILEQNYRSDTVSEGLLLSLNEGKTIDFQKIDLNGVTTLIEGKIIRSGYRPGEQQYNPYNNGYGQQDNSPLIEVDGKLQFGLPGTPLFPELSSDSILTPTLDWTIYADKSGALDAELDYITGGLTWNAAYNVVAPAKGSNLDITAWVTIDNESGTKFDNARIKLMAGDVNKIQPQSGGRLASDDMDKVADYPAQITFAKQQALDEYHLYTLPNATTLQNHETKQVLFLHATGVQSKELYVYDGLNLDPNQYNGWSYENIKSESAYGTNSTTKVAIERDFVNSASNGLGVPLPAGRVRFYRRDNDGQLEFIGEANIDHTPQDETVKVVTGDAFDIVGSRTRTNYSIDNDNNDLDESFSIVVTNHKQTPVEVAVREHLYREATWTIRTNSDSYNKIDSNTIEFPVTVPVGGSKTVTYTAHYAW